MMFMISIILFSFCHSFMTIKVITNIYHLSIKIEILSKDLISDIYKKNNDYIYMCTSNNNVMEFIHVNNTRHISLCVSTFSLCSEW